MSKEVDLAIADILENRKKIPKQPGNYRNSEYYDALCHGLPLALVGRKFNETEAERVFQFLKALYYDFQYANTIRTIFVWKNKGKVDPKWIRAFVSDPTPMKYFWKQLDNITSRIRHPGELSGKSLASITKALLGKIVKGKAK